MDVQIQERLNRCKRTHLHNTTNARTNRFIKGSKNYSKYGDGMTGLIFRFPYKVNIIISFKCKLSIFGIYRYREE